MPFVGDKAVFNLSSDENPVFLLCSYLLEIINIAVVHRVHPSKNATIKPAHQYCHPDI
jgi:hypothetical protein